MATTLETLKLAIIEAYQRIVDSNTTDVKVLKDISNSIDALLPTITKNINIYTGGTFKIGLDDLTDVYSNTVSGDSVIVASASYDLDTDSIQLKTGVNWQFNGNPTITSTSAAGTFYDNNLPVIVHFDGDLVITNSTNGASRVILQNSLSRIKGLVFTYKADWSFEKGAAPGLPTEYENTLGVVVDTLNSMDQIFTILFGDDVPESNHYIEAKITGPDSMWVEDGGDNLLYAARINFNFGGGNNSIVGSLNNISANTLHTLEDVALVSILVKIYF